MEMHLTQEQQKAALLAAQRELVEATNLKKAADDRFDVATQAVKNWEAEIAALNDMSAKAAKFDAGHHYEGVHESTADMRIDEKHDHEHNHDHKNPEQKVVPKVVVKN